MPVAINEIPLVTFEFRNPKVMKVSYVVAGLVVTTWLSMN